MIKLVFNVIQLVTMDKVSMDDATRRDGKGKYRSRKIVVVVMVLDGIVWYIPAQGRRIQAPAQRRRTRTGRTPLRRISALRCGGAPRA